MGCITCGAKVGTNRGAALTRACPRKARWGQGDAEPDGLELELTGDEDEAVALVAAVGILAGGGAAVAPQQAQRPAHPWHAMDDPEGDLLEEESPA